MTNKPVTIVSCYDWQALYVDGKKVRARKLITAWDLSEALGIGLKYTDVTGSKDASKIIRDLSDEKCKPCFPDNLEDIKNER